MRETEDARGDAGDVEAAGETTAADMVGCNTTTDERPVGADTLVRVDEKTKREEGADV